jgi:hypothetical protein
VATILLSKSGEVVPRFDWNRIVYYRLILSAGLLSPNVQATAQRHVQIFISFTFDSDFESLVLCDLSILVFGAQLSSISLYFR